VLAEASARRRRIPPWLMLIFSGTAEIGAGFGRPG